MWDIEILNIKGKICSENKWMVNCRKYCLNLRSRNNILKLDMFYAFKFPGHGHLGFHDVIALLYCFTQKNFFLLTIAANAMTSYSIIQNGSAGEI